MCMQCTYSHECMCMGLMFRSAVPLNGQKWELGVNQFFGISWQTNQWNVERKGKNKNNQFSNKLQQQLHYWAGKFCGIRAKLTTLNGGLPVAMPVRSLFRERESERVRGSGTSDGGGESARGNWSNGTICTKRVKRRRKSNWFGVCIMKLLKSVQFELINAIDIDSRKPRICRIMKNRIISW